LRNEQQNNEEVDDFSEKSFHLSLKSWTLCREKNATMMTNENMYKRNSQDIIKLPVVIPVSKTKKSRN
jgi:hypothetical protein